MLPHKFTIGRTLVLGIAAASLVLAVSTPTRAIMFGEPDHEEEVAQADAPAEGDEAAAEELDQELLAAGLEVYKEARCRGCHGWAANGEREGPNPQGPSLRDTLLDEAGLRMTVACGRPGSEMPYFWREAYRRDSTECYGVTGDELGDMKPLQANTRLRDDDLDALAYYLANYVKGQGEITRSQCEFFFGEPDRCETYPEE